MYERVERVKERCKKREEKKEMDRVDERYWKPQREKRYIEKVTSDGQVEGNEDGGKRVSGRERGIAREREREREKERERERERE